MHDVAERDVDEVAKFSPKDAERLGEFEAWIHGVADVLSPMLLRTPPRIGSHRPRDLLDQLRTAWGLRADRVIDGYDELAPNFKRSVIHRQVIGPWEMEHTYGLIGGNIFHGELSPDQLFHMRPAPGYADFTTPIDGLYQCSSATHGGGGVTGIPALLCSRRVLADERRRRLARRLRIQR